MQRARSLRWPPAEIDAAPGRVHQSGATRSRMGWSLSVSRVRSPRINSGIHAEARRRRRFQLRGAGTHVHLGTRLPASWRRR